jgi:uncharacterized protein
MSAPGFLRIQPDGVVLSLKVQPRAPVNRVGECLGNELRVKVTAPPVDAAANEAVIRLLSEVFDCPRSRIELVRGHTSRHKTIKLHGVTVESVLTKLG